MALLCWLIRKLILRVMMIAIYMRPLTVQRILLKLLVRVDIQNHLRLLEKAGLTRFQMQRLFGNRWALIVTKVFFI